MNITSSLATLPVPLYIDTGRVSPGAVRVAVSGAIDPSTAARLRDELLNVLFALHPRRIEVDLAGVTFLDRNAVTALMVAGKVAVGHGCRLRIANPQPPVCRVLALAGLLDVPT